VPALSCLGTTKRFRRQRPFSVAPRLCGVSGKLIQLFGTFIVMLMCILRVGLDNPWEPLYHQIGMLTLR
jgi:lipopolysaccharide/colanic/teichoic acid biosynthesis glycosyltransferase